MSHPDLFLIGLRLLAGERCDQDCLHYAVIRAWASTEYDGWVMS